MLQIIGNSELFWEFVKLAVPTIISGAALFFVLKDRRPRLDIRAKRGDWYKLTKTLTGSELIFRGVVEVYNRSSRANAIREYRFDFKDSDGKWKSMESEQYTNRESNGADAPEKVFNQTALTIAPYSGTEVPVQALTKIQRPKGGLFVRTRMKDLFGKEYQLEVSASF